MAQSMKALRILERAAFVLAWPVAGPLMLFGFALTMMCGVALLPVAALKFVVTGTSGIEWYFDVVLGWILTNAPMFVWADRIKGRSPLA